MSYPPGPDPQDPSGAGSPSQPYHWGQSAAPTQDERTWAWVAHAGSILAAWFAMGFLCPLLIMLTKGSTSPFVRRHAVESLNFQISLLIYLVISGILVLLVVGVFMLIALGVFALVTIIIATVKASNGEEYRYPLCIRLVS